MSDVISVKRETSWVLMTELLSGNKANKPAANSLWLRNNLDWREAA